jgi:hypothetical protein
MPVRSWRHSQGKVRWQKASSTSCLCHGALHHIPRTMHSTGFQENRGTGVDFPSPDPIIRLGEERKRGSEGDEMSRLIEIVTELVAEMRDWLFNEDYGE